jgi:general secretion pathway protein H
MRFAKADKIRPYAVECGFTLLEIILVLVIAATVAAVAVPNFQPALANMQLRAATGDVASALRYVRGQALSRGREAVFFLDVDRHLYTVSGRPKQYTLPASVRLGLFTAEAELSGEGQGNIRYYPDGSSTGGRVSLEATGKRRLVDVNWLTGAVVIREENP